MIWIDLIYNLAVLIALSVVSGFVDMRWKRHTLAGMIFQGMAFGSATVIGMLRPFVLGPGLIFDGRSVMISLGAFFFGPWTAAVACLMTIPLRIVQGGSGTVMGVAVILVSALIGTCYFRRHRGQPAGVDAPTLLLFGFIVHLAMLAATALLPPDLMIPVLKRIAGPVLSVYPLATLLIGKILSDQASRAQSIESLRQSEERHRAILQTAMDGCFLIDLHGRIKEVNQSYCRMSGYTEQELLSMSVKDLDANKTAEEVESSFQIISHQREMRMESRHRRKDGSLFDVAISAQYQPAKGGQIVVFLQDITERKKTQEALRESERKLREAQELAQLGHWVWDVRTGDVEWSDIVYNIFRLDPKTFSPHIDSILALSPWPEDHARDKELVRKAIADHCQGSYEQRFLRPDGSIGYYFSTFQGKFDGKGELFAIVGTVQDVTERKRAEEFREMGRCALHILNEEGPLEDLLNRVVTEIKTRTGCDAVGIRLQSGEDFPYFAQQGFPADFLQTENTLTLREADSAGRQQGQEAGINLACACGMVLSGRTDPTHPLFTRGGSFWTNNALLLRDLPPDQEFRRSPRNQCVHHGYASTALVPIRCREQTVGLIQLSDHRKGCFTLTAIELLEGIAAHIGAALMRRRAEDILRESEEMHRAIITASPIPMALHDDRERIFFLNPSFVQTFGYTLADIPTIADWWPKAYPDETYRASVVELWRTELAQLQRTGSFMPVEATVRCRDGTDKTVLSSVAALPGSLAHTFLSVFSDITEHKRTEEELLKIQKLQSIGTLAGGIAHDFNNILQGLFGNISLAKDSLSKEHPSHRLLEEAEKSLCMAVRLTKQLLTFAKGGEPVKEHISLSALVEEVVRFDLSGSPVSLVYQAQEGLWQVHADKGQLQQVISNLSINARQAMPNGGHLYVTLANAELDADAVPGLRAGQYVKVVVRDEGGGIDPQLQDRIFDPYFTTKPTGNGLGLATVYSIIRKHNGSVLVSSAQGQGATFTLYLPASPHPVQAEPVAPPAEKLAAPRSARVLVMDDEEPVRKLVVLILAAAGHNVETAADGQAAIAKCRQAVQAGRPFDVAIMDMTVPGGMGGKEAVHEILAMIPTIKAIVSSGYSEDPVMASPSEYGFCAAMAKPYSPLALQAIVAEVLRSP